MSYYMRGDYYRGDYYRGDLGGALSGALGGYATGGLPGAIIGGLSGLFGSRRPGTQNPLVTSVGNILSSGPQLLQPPSGHPITGSISTPIGSISVTPTAILPGGAPFVTFQGPSAAGECPKGFKRNRTSYFLKDGTFVAAGSRCVRFRSMNPLNHRALRKGLRRAEGFERIARRTVSALRRGAPKFKRKGRKR